MKNPKNFPSDFLSACRKNGIAPTRFALVATVSGQTLSLFENASARSGGRQTDALLKEAKSCGSLPGAAAGEFHFVKKFRCSTSRFGIGQVSGSNGTPLGLHRIAEKIGGGWPLGTVYKSRKPIGYTWKGLPLAKITSRILWLDGLEPGFNRGGHVDSHGRYIYIHGTGDEPSLGRPASCGCMHLAADDLIPLYDRLPVGTLVWVER